MVVRSLLYTPGNEPRKVSKVGTVGADGVILDLEDAVPTGQAQAAAAGWGGDRLAVYNAENARERIADACKGGRSPMFGRTEGGARSQYQPSLGRLLHTEGALQTLFILPTREELEVRPLRRTADGGEQVKPRVLA